MKGKEIQELDDVELESDSVMLVQTSGVTGKTTLAKAREAIGVTIDSVSAETEALEIGEAITADVETTGSEQEKNITFKFGLPEIRSVKSFKQTTASSANSGTNIYTAVMSNGDTETFTCKNGKGINSITQTKSSTTSGEENSYKITLSDNSTFTISVYNGRAGKDFKISKTYVSIAAMEADFGGTDVDTYDFVMIDTGSTEDEDTGKLYYKNTTAWEYIGDLSGKQGIKGERGISIESIELKSAEGGSKGANVYTVTMDDGTTKDLTVYNGDDGTPADFGNVTADIEMLAVTESASVEATTDKSTPITARDMNFSFKIPKPNGIAKIEQTTVSEDNDGINVWTATLDNGDSSEFKVKNGKTVITETDIKTIMLRCHPIGSLYWSSDSTDPGEIFGGTWGQIKDKFILAAGDSYNNGDTGGSKTVTLTTANMPSHTHSFTPKGTVTVSSHSHTLNSHTHSFTPSGTVSSHSHNFRNTSLTSSSGSSLSVLEFANSGTGSSSYTYAAYSQYPSGTVYGSPSLLRDFTISNYTTASVTDRKYLVNGYPSNANVLGIANATPTFTGTAGTTGAASGSTGSATPTGTFTGTAGTTGSAGTGNAFSILPPYIVKYCWERTA